jgi:hypothetical protein
MTRFRGGATNPHMAELLSDRKRRNEKNMRFRILRMVLIGSALAGVAIFSFACGGHVGNGGKDDGTRQAATITGHWTEPQFNVGWSDVQGDTSCGAIGYYNNAQFYLTVSGCNSPGVCAKYDPHHIEIVSIQDYVSAAQTTWRANDGGSGSHLGGSRGWVRIISNYNRTLDLWPNPWNTSWGGYESGCVTESGAWCMVHGSNGNPLYNLVDNYFSGYPQEYPVRIIHYSGVDVDDCGTTYYLWSSHYCTYDLTDWSTGTWTQTSCS